MLPFPSPAPGQPALALAPMEGVTDAPMRALQTESGAFQYCVSEFLRVCLQEVPGKVFRKHVPELADRCQTPSGVCVQVQLLGGDPQALAHASLVAVQLGARGIDLNFGCPAPTVNRHDGGATLLQFPHRIRQIVSTVRETLPKEVPLSAKLRLGWERTDSILENALQAAMGGANWITIHGRTRAAGYSPPIYWEPIGEVRKQLAPLPIVANGDIWRLEDFRRCREITGCEHFMLGRGALADPLLPVNIAAELGIRPMGSQAPLGNKPRDWVPFFERFSAFTGEHPSRSLLLARRIKQWTWFATRYGQVDWFDCIKTLSTYESITEELRRMH